ncbi:DUF3888 domain-containing protein [Paenibacillus alginolyticus]|uniref:DUF3888 domain-containing protein n=1 Tax=Paenibacillus alginolyticus TaxID=59839 RepID=A0ABT4GMB6_9BACL|nr:DUF3888 domain-containing protein [Paenibacillus alginolyticus]MCY9697332.1 DUF3888 domain-containing protein [Paenibacillus alginolyticus]MEC0145249.1 DUF3888 domain-containing protein [Paenibacillus alginolyticus]
MKKWVSFLLIFFAFSFSTKAATEMPKANELQKEILHDLAIREMYPSMSQALDKQFGPNHQLGLQCQKILEIKKVDPGSFYFEVTMEGMTYKGAHNPPNDILTVIMSNYNDTGKWVIKEYSIKERPANYVCRNPV